DAAVLLDQTGRLGAHVQIEVRIALAPLGQEVEEVPLRHQGDEFAVGRQMREVGDLHASVADDAGEMFDLLMRQLEELVQQPELMDEFERGGMDGVAAEVAQEVACFSSTTTATPARASRNPSIMPAGPPPAMQQVVVSSSVNFRAP